MCISQMTYVPHQAIVGRVEHVVHGYRELYHTERRAKVARILRKFIDEKLAQLVTHLGQLRELQLTQVGRCLYRVQYIFRRFFIHLYND